MASLLACRLGNTLRPFCVPFCLRTLPRLYQSAIKTALPQLQHLPRFASTGGGKLPFEVSEKVAKDTLVFSYKNDNFYRMVSIFGILQFFFWFHLGVFAYSDFKKVQSKQGRQLFDEELFWGRILQLQAKAKDKIAFLCIGVAYIVLFFTWMYPQRSIKGLKLLKGGEKVLVTTYTHFGRQRSFQIHLKHINCMQPRSRDAVQVSLKLKGHRFYFLMDKRKGVFHEPKLFDYVIGLQRKL